MDYLYEALNDETFQKLCQALLVKEFPNVQCLPVGQPDGGRDAVLASGKNLVVFQVKFSKDPNSKSEREAIEDLIRTESAKINALIERGMTAYYFITNVSGTSHLASGSIDRTSEVLSERFEVPAFCWWRDDLDRRLDSSADLKWRYPQVTTGADVLQLVAASRDKEIEIALTTFKKYVAKQHLDDEEVKFQQVQIQSKILDLFIDIPVAFSRRAQPSGVMREIPEYVMYKGRSYPYHYAPGIDRGRMAASWLLKEPLGDGVQRIVLEGAPGQGKSTVTQYVCQVHRTRILDHKADYARIDDAYLQSPLRLPFRIDLRDYALWLGGQNPNAIDRSEPRPPDATDALESFLAFQVRTLSGGMMFDQRDLDQIASSSHLLIVLDGFDEVADLRTRARLLAQIRDAANRLEVTAKSLQIVVTSRPAAFALSAGFPEREWSHHALTAMDRGQISQYADKWVQAKGFGARDAADFQTVLMDRLSQTHIRSLAQNPMQLAILLTLISTKGRSLPDKRTALYDSYMDLFFGREAEKDTTVRNNRDLLIKLHQFIAWTLHIEAEAAKGAGSVSKERLIALVRDYINFTGHQRRDVEQLFAGVVVRVGALVSRVEGTFEFEVQPLREYFAGRYLYEGAPYSPAGNEKGGTKPERFESMSKLPYWANTVRFYCGCYSSGELASLVDGLAMLMEHEPFSNLGRPRQLAVMLLTDYVFAQEPRTVRNVVALLIERKSWLILLSQLDARDQFQAALPDECGREIFIESATRSLLESERFDEAIAAARLISVNMDRTQRKELVVKAAQSGHQIADIVNYLSVGDMWTADDLHILSQYWGPDAFQIVVGEGLWSLLSGTLSKLCLEATLDGHSALRISLYYRRDRREEDFSSLEYFASMFAFLSFYPVYGDFSESAPLRRSLQQVLPTWTVSERRQTPKEISQIIPVLDVFDRVSAEPMSVWLSSLDPWNALVEIAREHFGDRWAIRKVAAIAAGIRSRDYRSRGFDALNDGTTPLAERARSARLKSGNYEWWEQQLQSARTIEENLWVLLNALSWCTAGALEKLAVRLSEKLDSLPDIAWERLAESVREVVSATRDSRRSLRFGRRPSAAFSDRLSLVISCRLSDATTLQIWETRFREYSGADPLILEHCEQSALALAFRSVFPWKHALATLRMTLAKLGRRQRRSLFVSGRSRIPLETALEVCRNPELYPLAMVTASEARLAASSQSSQPKVGYIAARDDWFPEHNREPELSLT